MDSHGLPWTPVDSHGVPWTPRESDGLPWSPMRQAMQCLCCRGAVLERMQHFVRHEASGSTGPNAIKELATALKNDDFKTAEAREQAKLIKQYLAL
eukprot:10417610-Lingulodinium_polyedra.AAC.1